MNKGSEADLADCVGAIYEAAANAGDWKDVGDRIRAITGAQRATFSLADERGRFHNVLRSADESETLYNTYYHLVDPYRERARRDYGRDRARHLCTAKVGAELVTEEHLLRSEYYIDYARHHQRRYMMGGMIGVVGSTPIGLFRGDDAHPFEASDCRLLESVLPHMQRALELRARLGRAAEAAWATRAVLDSLAANVIIVDTELKIVFANIAGGRRLSKKHSGLRTNPGGLRFGSGTYLAVQDRAKEPAVRRLVESAARGNAGGSLRIVNGDKSTSIVIVSPTPRSLSVEDPREDHKGLASGLAVVLIQDITTKPVVRAEVLCDIFGFSAAEAEVAIALSGGINAEDVARQRNVTLSTVRSQVRSILQKAGAANLRDLEKMIASLAAVTR